MLGTRVKRSMSLEILMPCEATLTDLTLERLEGRSSFWEVRSYGDRRHVEDVGSGV